MVRIVMRYSAWPAVRFSAVLSDSLVAVPSRALSIFPLSVFYCISALHILSAGHFSRIFSLPVKLLPQDRIQFHVHIPALVV